MSDHQAEVSDAEAKRPYAPPALRELGAVPEVTATDTVSPTDVDGTYTQPIS